MRTARSVVALVLAASVALPTALIACGGDVATPTRTRFDPPSGGGGVVADSGPSEDAGADGSLVDGGPQEDGGPLDAGPSEDLAPITEIFAQAVPSGDLVTFTVPANTLGMQVLAGTATEQAVGVSDLTAPDGTAVSREFIPTKGTFATQVGLAGLGAASVPVQELPVTMPAVAAGDWSATVFSDSGDPVDTKVRVLQTDDGAFHGGTLDVHLWIPDGLRLNDGDAIVPVNGAGAATQPAVARRMDAFYTQLTRLTGIGRGAVTLHTLPARFVTLDGPEGEDELNALYRSSTATGNERAMHFFWVKSSPNLSWWGIASGIPGAAQSPGTPLAGVVLASIDEAPPEYEGAVMLHEMGHFVGLQHPTEFDDLGVDPLEDTPTCPGLSVTNSDRCPDRDNVMFAAGSLDAAALVLSPLQQRIVRGSLVYKAFRRDPAAPAPNPAPFAPPAPTHAPRWRPATRLAASLLGACFHGGLPKVSAADRPALVALTADAAAPPFVRARARRLLASLP